MTDNTQECIRKHVIVHQEQYAGGDILESFAPALPIYALLLTTIRKLVFGKLVKNGLHNSVLGRSSMIGFHLVIADSK